MMTRLMVLDRNRSFSTHGVCFSHAKAVFWPTLLVHTDDTSVCRRSTMRSRTRGIFWVGSWKMMVGYVTYSCCEGVSQWNKPFVVVALIIDVWDGSRRAAEFATHSQVNCSQAITELCVRMCVVDHFGHSYARCRSSRHGNTRTSLWMWSCLTNLWTAKHAKGNKQSALHVWSGQNQVHFTRSQLL